MHATHSGLESAVGRSNEKHQMARHDPVLHGNSLTNRAGALSRRVSAVTHPSSRTMVRRPRERNQSRGTGLAHLHARLRRGKGRGQKAPLGTTFP